MKKYYELAKPGIIYGNSITAIAGFFLAIGTTGQRIFSGHINWLLLLAMLVGLGLVMGGACVFNNCLDRDIDSKMSRTQTRATVTHEISKRISLRNAWIYGSVLFILGAVTLFIFTNILTLCIALIGTAVYVGLYTPLKRRTIYSTIIGAVSGATPPVVGFCAVTSTFNLEALLLFLILFFWQMPHFYAIAIYRQSEYEAAGIPLLPIKKGVSKTKIHILVYICLFTLAAALLGFLYFTQHIYLYIYLGVVAILAIVWLHLSITGFYPQTDSMLANISSNISWAKKMFLFSLVVITVWSLVVAVGGSM